MLLAIKNAIHTDQLLMPNHLEIISCNITFNNFSFYVCLIYRPPNSNEVSDALLLSYLDLHDDSKNIVILSDLNLTDIDWDTYTSNFGTSSAIADLAYDYNMCKLVSNPMHIMGNTLDVILMNSDSFCDMETSKLPYGLSSDYYMITFFNKHIFVKPNIMTKYIFDYSKANWDGMNQYLSSFNFDEYLQSNDVEFIWSQLKFDIYDTHNLFVPKFQIKSNTSPKWFTPTIRHKLHCIHTLRRKCTSHPTLKPS